MPPAGVDGGPCETSVSKSSQGGHRPPSSTDQGGRCLPDDTLMRIFHVEPAHAVLTQHRSTSATLQAWAMQPRGVNGGSASKISLIEPTPASSRWATSPPRNARAPARSSGWTLSQASTNGPISQDQTVPW